jgi:hypothetical protein
MEYTKEKSHRQLISGAVIHPASQQIQNITETSVFRIKRCRKNGRTPWAAVEVWRAQERRRMKNCII